MAKSTTSKLERRGMRVGEMALAVALGTTIGVTLVNTVSAFIRNLVNKGV